MDDQDKALNPEGETETTPDTTPVSEETTTDESISEEESQKKGYSARIRELNARAKAAEQQVQSLTERMAALTEGVPQGGQMPYTQPPEALAKPT